MIFKNPKSETRNPKLGFSLIEVIVSMGIFVTAVVGLSALFVGVLRIQRQAFVESLVVDNARYAMDEMTRAIRVSDIEAMADNTPQDFIIMDEQPMLDDAFGFSGCSASDPTDCLVRYHYDGGTRRLQERRANGSSFPIRTWFLDLAGDATVVQVNRFQASAFGCGDSDNRQPRVTLGLETSHRQAVGVQPLLLQTTVSLRQIRDGCD